MRCEASRLTTGVLSEAEFFVERMAACAEGNFLTVTELADTLVRATAMDFRTAHEIVTAAVKELHGGYDLERMAAAVERILAGHTPYYHVAPETLRLALTAQHFVAVRVIAGGPGAGALDPEIERAKAQCAADRMWVAEMGGVARKAMARTRAEVEGLLARVNV